MFIHALESFRHSVEHYLDPTPRSRKFAILHMDHAVELFLKERVVGFGKSIYKSDGTTLNLHETFSALKSISIPERPRLEELHDLRNAIQHKGILPDSGTTQFFLNIGYQFAKRFLQEEMNFASSGLLSQKYQKRMEGLPPEGAEEVFAAMNSAQHAQSLVNRIVLGYTALNRAVVFLEDRKVGKLSFRKSFRQEALQRGAKRKDIDTALQKVFNLRNKVIQSSYEPTPKDANEFFVAAYELLRLTGFTQGSNRLSSSRSPVEVAGRFVAPTVG
jgi:hypothetical protein